jgi:sarcosine oxidase
MSNRFDLIIIGCGGVGSAAAYYAAKHGLRVLALERFEPVHSRGSSHGDTRVIRQAYFEHPDYVPLLKRAYDLWQQLEDHVGRKLFYRTGLLEVGPESGVLIPGIRQSGKQHELPLEEISRSEFRHRFPGFHLPHDSVAVFESNAGFLLVEECIRQYIHQAQRLGGDLRFKQAVQGWSVQGNEVCVRTDGDLFYAPRLVITAGAWASELLVDLGVPLRVLRKHLHWYPVELADAYREDKNSPTFFYETAAGYFYGFPVRDARGLKVAQHSGGEAVSDPLQVDRSLDLSERALVDRFLQVHLPQVTIPATAHAVCMYTMSPDEHFIIDRHPQHPQVAFAAGLSGHGFKFASVLGETLVQFAIDGAAQLPMEFLSCRRFE